MGSENVVDGIFRVRSSREILSYHLKAVVEIKSEFAGMDEAQFIDEILENAVSYVGDLPASEYHHHSGFAGLLSHMLEVSLLTVRMARGRPLRGDLYGTAKFESEKRWIFASWLCGFLHDIGKIFSDIEVFSERGELWNPHVQSFESWVAEQKVKGYRVKWQSSRYHNKHESRGVVGFERIVTSKVKEHLAAHNLGIYDALLDYLSGKGKAGYISDIVKKADGKSIENNTAMFWKDTLGERKSFVERRLALGIRRLLGTWKINSLDGSVFVVGGSVLLRYPECFEDLVRLMSAEQAAIPMDPFKLLTMLEDIGWIEVPEDKSGTYLLSYKGSLFDVVKVRYEAMFFDDHVMPDSIDAVVLSRERVRAGWVERTGLFSSAKFERNCSELDPVVKEIERDPNMGIVFEVESDPWSVFCGVIRENGYQIDGEFLIAAANDIFIRWPDLSVKMMMEKDECLDAMDEFLEGWIDTVSYNGDSMSCVKLKSEWAGVLLEVFGWSLKDAAMKGQKRKRKLTGGFVGLNLGGNKRVQRRAQVSQVDEGVKEDRLISMATSGGECDLVSFYKFLGNCRRSGKFTEDIVVSEERAMVWLNVKKLVSEFETDPQKASVVTRGLGRLSLKSQSRKGVAGYVFDFNEVFGN